MITVLADDLSGALDTGVVFQERWDTVVVPDEEGYSNLIAGENRPPVVVRNLADRHLSAHASAALRQTAALQAEAEETLYLKVDSTLRGPVGAQVEAVLTAVPRYRVALVCPAFPQNGRTVIDGHLYVEGQRVERSALGRDPHNPITSGDLVEILAQTTALPIHRLMHAPMGSQLGVWIYVADARSDSDLAEIARYLGEHPDVLPVGSQGLAKALCRVWHQGDATVRPRDVGAPAVDQIVAVVGTLPPTTRQQVATMKSRPGWEILDTIAGSRIPDQAHVILTTPNDPIANAEAAIEDLVGHAAQYIQTARHRLLVVATGGDTVLALMRRLHVHHLTPRQEIAPGVVWSEGMMSEKTLFLVTKSGAFGGTEFFQTLVEWTRSRSGSVIPRRSHTCHP